MKSCQVCSKHNSFEKEDSDEGEIYPSNDYEQSTDVALATNKHEWHKREKMFRKAKGDYTRPMDNFNLSRTLLESLLFPEYSKGVKLPSQYQMPTYCYQLKNSFTVKTNSLGNALVQVVMGQYLDASNFYIGEGTGADIFSSTNPALNGATSSTSTDKNGTSTWGQSNVFVCNSSLLTGTNTLATANGGAVKASPIMKLNSGLFNTVRPGPMSLKYEYIGRLDAASGTVTAGISYSTVDPDSLMTDKTKGGLLADLNYTTVSAIEDCPFARTVNITDPLKCVFIPHDYSALNFRNSKDAAATVVPQRCSVLITGAPAESIVARFTITANFEGIPTKEYADLLTLSYNTFPSDFDHQYIYNTIMEENLVITKDHTELGLNNLMSKLFAVYN